MLYLLFINNFEIYKNIYRALKAFYLIFAYLNYLEKRKFINIFILLLNLYEIKIEKIIKVFNKLIRILNSEVNLNINKNIKII